MYLGSRAENPAPGLRTRCATSDSRRTNEDALAFHGWVDTNPIHLVINRGRGLGLVQKHASTGQRVRRAVVLNCRCCWQNGPMTCRSRPPLVWQVSLNNSICLPQPLAKGLVSGV